MKIKGNDFYKEGSFKQSHDYYFKIIEALDLETQEQA